MGERIAVMSDIHGNLPALQSILADLNERDISQIYNLGDCLKGPLFPDETYQLLRSVSIIHVRGNGDRTLAETMHKKSNKTGQHIATARDQSAWLLNLPVTHATDDFFFVHGTQESDTTYLLEELTPDGVVPRSPEAIDNLLREIPQAVIFCGHSHLPKALHLPSGKLVINPGSVGNPAYFDEEPYPHKMESGNPYAKYVIFEKREGQSMFQQMFIPYDVNAAAEQARRNNRPDWAHHLLWGFTE